MSEKRAVVPSNKQAQQLKDLIARGKEQGFLTYAEVNDHLPNDIVDPEQIEDIVNMINDMGITVHEKAPDAESILLSDAAVSNDDDAAEEAEAALASVDAEFGRTTDPVRMYMREMGTVELLTRQGEIEIAKRIEDGLNQVKWHMSHFPPTIDLLLEVADRVFNEETRMQDFVVGFIDPNAPDEIKPPAPKSDDDEVVIDTGPDPDEVKARVKVINALSAHGDRNDLLNYYKGSGINASHTFVVHGELEYNEALAEGLNELGAKNVTIPEPEQSFEV